MDLSIIIVNWNSAALVKQCLCSVYETVHRLTFEVIVVDNASFDGCNEILAQEFQRVKFIQNDINAGFGAANNIGFRASQGRNLLFLNPDTIVPPGAIEALYRNLESALDAGAVGGRLVDGSNALRAESIMAFPSIAGEVLDARCLRRLIPRCRLWGAGALFGNSAEPVVVDVICGACLMVKRTAFEEVGCFTSGYFMYCEEVDLCYKLEGSGWRRYFVPEVTVIHFGGSSTSRYEDDRLADVLMQQSMWVFFFKVKGRLYACLYRVSVGVAGCLRLALAAVAMGLAPVFGGRTMWRSVVRKWSAKVWWSIASSGRGFTKLGTVWSPPL